jgi:hypothetical protein
MLGNGNCTVGERSSFHSWMAQLANCVCGNSNFASALRYHLNGLCNESSVMQALEIMAERVGFEPTLPFRVNTLSKRAPSATRPSLRRRVGTGSRVLRQEPQAAPFVLCHFLLDSMMPSAQPASQVAGGKPLVASAFSSLPPTRYSLLFLMQLLGQVILNAHLVDGVQLPFQPVDVFFLVDQDALQQIP